MNEFAPKTPWFKKAWVIGIATGVFGLLIGIGVSGPKTEVVTMPSVTVTPEPKTETITKTVVPDACIEATNDIETLLSLSGEYISIIADLSDISSRGVDAAVAWDYETLDSITLEVSGLLTRMDAQQAVIDGLDVDVHVQGCRAAQ